MDPLSLHLGLIKHNSTHTFECFLEYTLDTTYVQTYDTIKFQ